MFNKQLEHVNFKDFDQLQVDNCFNSEEGRALSRKDLDVAKDPDAFGSCAKKEGNVR